MEDGDPQAADLTINKDDLREIRCFMTPPQDVLTVVSAALRLLGYPMKPKQDWVQAIRFLNTSGKDSVLCRMKEFNKDAVTPKVARTARKSLEGLNPEDLKRASKAAFGLFLWGNQYHTTCIAGMTRVLQTKNKIDQLDPAAGQETETSP